MFNRSTTASVKNFRVCLDALPNGSTLYYPGDAVQGAVVFTVSASGVSDDQALPAKFRCVSISFKGRAIFRAKESCEATICNQISYLKLPEGCDTVPTNLSSGSVEYKALPTGLLAPGQYALPFSFKIPLDAPASTTQIQCPLQIGISYTLSASIHLVGVFHKTASEQVHVTSVMSQEQVSMERSHLAEFPATLPMSSLFGSNGVVEVVAKMKGRALVDTQKEEGLAITVDVTACGNKAVDGATVELQRVTQVDHWSRGHFSEHEKQFSDRPGDLRFCKKFRTLMPSKTVVTDAESLEHNRPEYEHSGMGTASDGYVVSNGVPLGSYSFARTVSTTKLCLRNTSGSACNGGTKLPPGSSGSFVGTVALNPRELALPTLRMSQIQRNYRVIIRLGGVSKSICLPVVVVSDVVSNQQQEVEGFQLPWMHHEKVYKTLHSHDKTEVAAPTTTSSAAGSYPSGGPITAEIDHSVDDDETGGVVVEGRLVDHFCNDDDQAAGLTVPQDELPSYEEAVLGTNATTTVADGCLLNTNNSKASSYPPPPAYGIEPEDETTQGLSSSSSDAESDDQAPGPQSCWNSSSSPSSSSNDDQAVAAYYRSLGYN